MILKRISRAEAVDLLRHCVEDGEVQYGPHFRKALEQESVDIVDAWAVLRCGQIFDEPEPDIKTREWKYRVEGHEPGGKWLTIVFSFKEVNRVFLITVFSIESRRKR